MATNSPRVTLTDEQRAAAPKEKNYADKVREAKAAALHDPERAAIILKQREKAQNAKIAGAKRD